MEKSREMAKLAVTALEDKKGEDIRVIDIREVSTIADYFVIASGSNVNQVQAMVDSVEETLGSVSYTHLDVYKRQLQICGCSRFMIH